MYPILFQIGTVSIYSYGVFIAVGIISAFALGKRLAFREGIEWRPLFRTKVFTVLAAFLGARILYPLTSVEAAADPSTSGFVFYGVPLFGIPVFLLAARREGLPPARCADLLAVCLCLAQSIGRLGCFFAGCCHGRPTSFPLSVKLYSKFVPEALQGLPLHPIQLYSSVSEFLLFIFLFWRFRSPHRSGEILLLYIVGYGTLRFLQEFLRGDDIERGIWFGVSSSQIMASVTVLVTLPLLVWLRRVRVMREEGCARPSTLSALRMKK